MVWFYLGVFICNISALITEWADLVPSAAACLCVCVAGELGLASCHSAATHLVTLRQIVQQVVDFQQGAGFSGGHIVA